MYDIKGFQPLFVFVVQGAVDVLDPPVVRDVVPRGAGVKVDDGVVAGLHHRFQLAYQVEQGLVEIKVSVEKPFAYDHYHGAVVLVYASHVNAVGGLDFRQVH